MSIHAFEIIGSFLSNKNFKKCQTILTMGKERVFFQMLMYFRSHPTPK